MTLRCRVALARKHWSPKRAAGGRRAAAGRAPACAPSGANVARSSGVDLARRVAPAPRLARRLRLRGGEAERREVDLRRPPQHEVHGRGRESRNLKPWPEKPAHTTVRSPVRSTIGDSLAVIA